MLPSRSTRVASSRRAAASAGVSARSRLAIKREVLHTLGKHSRKRERDVSAHRMTDHRRAFDAERVEQCGDIGGKPFHQVRTFGRA